MSIKKLHEYDIINDDLNILKEFTTNETITRIEADIDNLIFEKFDIGENLVSVYGKGNLLPLTDSIGSVSDFINLNYSKQWDFINSIAGYIKENKIIFIGDYNFEDYIDGHNNITNFYLSNYNNYISMYRWYSGRIYILDTFKYLMYERNVDNIIFINEYFLVGKSNDKYFIDIIQNGVDSYIINSFNYFNILPKNQYFKVLNNFGDFDFGIIPLDIYQNGNNIFAIYQNQTLEIISSEIQAEIRSNFIKIENDLIFCDINYTQEGSTVNINIIDYIKKEYVDIFSFNFSTIRNISICSFQDEINIFIFTDHLYHIYFNRYSDYVAYNKFQFNFDQNFNINNLEMYCSGSNGITLYMKSNNLIYKFHQTTQSKITNSSNIIEKGRIAVSNTFRSVDSEKIVGKFLETEYNSKTLNLKSGRKDALVEKII